MVYNSRGSGRGIHLCWVSPFALVPPVIHSSVTDARFVAAGKEMEHRPG